MGLTKLIYIFFSNSDKFIPNSDKFVPKLDKFGQNSDIFVWNSDKFVWVLPKVQINLSEFETKPFEKNYDKLIYLFEETHNKKKEKKKGYIVATWGRKLQKIIETLTHD